MAKYTAISAVSISGSVHKKGDTFEADSKSAHVTTALHFKQIKPVSDKEADADAKAKAKAEADEKAKAEADAKANK